MRFKWLVILILMTGCSSLFPPEELSGNYDDVLVIGHRGAAGLAPENTLIAMQTAIDLGVDAVEFDVHRSADGVLVVIHDEDVSRTTDGEDDVRDLTVAELQSLDAGSWFDEQFAGESVPTVVEVFDAVADNDVLLFIELKSPALYPGIESDLVELIHDYNYGERVHILSFDHRSLARIQAIDTTLILSGLWIDDVPSSGGGFDVVNARYTYYRYNRDAIGLFHEQGIQVMTWTVNDERTMRSLLDDGIDGITTDYPDRLINLLSSGDG